MARLSTHVLDTAYGRRPANGMKVRLSGSADGSRELLKSVVANPDGRSSDSGEICTDPRPPFGVLGLSLRR